MLTLLTVNWSNFEYSLGQTSQTGACPSETVKQSNAK